jgi:prolyl-tRNA editing enzyme YbaK/EbsC (Cys-tRNA(Pro) deacylase)
LGSRERVAEFLAKSGKRFEIKDFAESTKSSAFAARVLGCTVAEIAKSVVFVGEMTAVVIISGDKRVNTSKLGNFLGGDVRMANPDEARESTGYPIGGVPPFPHSSGVVVLPEVSLTRFREVWAAAGAPNAVFKMEVPDLLNLVGQSPHDLSE